jgi:exonuclease 1
MLSGCDYLPSIPGLGVKTSHKLLRKHKTIEGVLHAIRMGSQLKIPPNYLRDFRTAELAFLYQRVYDPRSERLVTLAKLPEDMGDWDDRYVGKYVPFYFFSALCVSL